MSFTFKNKDGVSLAEALSRIKHFLGIEESEFSGASLQVDINSADQDQTISDATSIPERSQEDKDEKDSQTSKGDLPKSPNTVRSAEKGGVSKNLRNRSLRPSSVTGTKFIGNRTTAIPSETMSKPEESGFKMSKELRLRIIEEAELEAQEWLSKVVGQRRLVSEAFEIKLQRQREGFVISEKEARTLAINRFKEDYVSQVLLSCGTLGENGMISNPVVR
jgi:hypothetical protein